MAKYIVNAAVEDFQTGEVVDIDPAMFPDLIEGRYLSPIDDWGNRLTPDGSIMVLGSTTEEQRREREAQLRYDAGIALPAVGDDMEPLPEVDRGDLVRSDEPEPGE